MTPDRTEALERLGRSFKGVTAAARRLRGRETHRPGELSFAQSSLLFGLGEAGELWSASWLWPLTSRRPPSRRCSTASTRPASSNACARSATGAWC
jgi:hypothetical protein